RGRIHKGRRYDTPVCDEHLRPQSVLDTFYRDLRLHLTLKHPADRESFADFSVNDQSRPGNYRLSISADGRAYTLSSADGVDLERGTVGDSIGRRLGFRWLPAPGTLPSGGTVDFSLMTPRDAALALGEQLDVRMDFNGNFLAVELRGTNPVMISKILNGVAQRYVEGAAE